MTPKKKPPKPDLAERAAHRIWKRLTNLGGSRLFAKLAHAYKPEILAAIREELSK